MFSEENINSDDAYLIGLFLGDGMITDAYDYQTITSTDNYIYKFCENYCLGNGIEHRVYYRKKGNAVDVIFKKFDWFFNKYDIERSICYDKRVPYIIRTSNKNSQVCFLKGLFDTDGSFDGRCIVLTSTSYNLIKEVQLMLLNMNMVSRIKVTPSKDNRRESYRLILNNVDMRRFVDVIGFDLDRKLQKANDYLESKNSNTNIDTIPFIKDICLKFDVLYREVNGNNKYDPRVLSLHTNKWNASESTYYRLKIFIDDVSKVASKEFSINEEMCNSLEKISSIYESNYFFDTVKSISDWTGDCYDFEMDMEDEPNYFANGFINHNTFLLGINAALHALLYPGYRVGLLSPSFRQSKMIFSEVEKLYNRSPILRQACEKKPTRGADTCHIIFKSTDNTHASYIEALPIGVDGAKIRGSRFYLIEIDELAQMPPDIIDLVIRPMAAVHSEPMQKVREIERIEKLIKLGLATEDDLHDGSANKMIMTSSGYYKFNHMWGRMKSYWKEIRREQKQYAVHQVPYTMMPRGFLDMTNIEEAKRTMSSIQFMMEYEAAMTSDSEGFFKASLLEACTIDSGFSVQLQGYADKEYVLGIDPNQGGSALYGLVLVELGSTSRIVYVRGLKKLSTQEMTERVQRLSNTFNIKRIYMDAQGGGNAIKDLLAEGYNNSIPILDMDDEKNKYKAGRKILKLINFSPTWISDANFGALALFENNRLRFPELPRSANDSEEAMYDDVRLLKSQMLNIVVTETARGVRHFDTPKKGQNKDLYSAILLAACGVKELAQDDYEEPVLQGSGLVRPRGVGAQFTNRNIPSSARDGLAAAVLRPRV